MKLFRLATDEDWSADKGFEALWVVPVTLREAVAWVNEEFQKRVAGELVLSDEEAGEHPWLT